jgi:hypothetical protein
VASLRAAPPLYPGRPDALAKSPPLKSRVQETTALPVRPRVEPATATASLAIGTVSAKEDLGHLADRLAAPFAIIDLELHVIQAGDMATIDADEMGVTRVVFVLRIDRFEPPNVVSQFGPSEEASLGQVVEVTKRGRLINAAGGESLGEVGVGQWRVGGPQLEERRDPRRGGPKTGGADVFAGLFDMAILGRLPGPRGLGFGRGPSRRCSPARRHGPITNRYGLGRGVTAGRPRFHLEFQNSSLGPRGGCDHADE